MKINPDVDCKPLMVDVVLQAVRDLKSPNLLLAIDAALFLTSRDFPWWAEAIGLPDANAFKLITGRTSLKRAFNSIRKSELEK